MLLFIQIEENKLYLDSDFNTSHVTVYHTHRLSEMLLTGISIHLMLLFIRISPGLHDVVRAFQYISCYCLSGFHSRISDRTVFQYISCYCLSGRGILWSGNEANFNTSHVTVYPNSSSHSSAVSLDFNTSHVTVYRMSGLLAIVNSSFQYISCYCLSRGSAMRNLH